MKTPLNLFASIATLAALMYPAVAADRPTSSKSSNKQTASTTEWSLSVDVLMVAMPQEKAIALLPDLRDPAKIEGAVTQILSAIEKKEATLTGWPMVETISGQRGVSESIYEKRYPVEFGLPTGSTDQSKAKPADDKLNISDGPPPTAFETRNVGTTLEVEPVVVAGGELIRLSLNPQRVGFLGFEPFSAGTTPSGHPIKIDQPQFYSVKTTNSIALRNGERRLLGIHKSPQQDNQLELFIVRATATPIK